MGVEEVVRGHYGGTELEERVLAAVVQCQTGDAVSLGYADGSFDRAMLVHVGMNVPDKPAVFAEVRRVLEPGGLFAIYDQMRVGSGKLTFPLPWADDESSSFVESPDGYAAALVAAGYEVLDTEDRTHLTSGQPPGV